MKNYAHAPRRSLAAQSRWSTRRTHVQPAIIFLAAGNANINYLGSVGRDLEKRPCSGWRAVASRSHNSAADNQIRTKGMKVTFPLYEQTCTRGCVYTIERRLGFEYVYILVLFIGPRSRVNEGKSHLGRIADGVWLLRNRWFSPYRPAEHNETCLSAVDHNPSWKSIQLALAWKMPGYPTKLSIVVPRILFLCVHVCVCVCVEQRGRQEWNGWTIMLAALRIDRSIHRLEGDRNLTDLHWSVG